MARYVPKTYNNRRLLRLIVGAVITIALSVVILFLILFFIFNQYAVDGRLEIPWLIEDTVRPSPPTDSSDIPFDESSESPSDESYDPSSDKPFDPSSDGSFIPASDEFFVPSSDESFEIEPAENPDEPSDDE